MPTTISISLLRQERHTDEMNGQISLECWGFIGTMVLVMEAVISAIATAFCEFKNLRNVGLPMEPSQTN